MNIIKLKDIIMPDIYNISEGFNKYLKGKYAYWIQMRYIVPLEFMRHEGYVACEEDINKLLKNDKGEYPKPYGCWYVDMYDENRCIMKYIDTEETNKANNISFFESNNNLSTDPTITLDDLKLFRRGLAQLIKDYNNIFFKDDSQLDDMTEHMIDYYINDMKDDVIKYLTMFSGVTVFNASETKCGCNGANINYIGSIESIMNNKKSKTQTVDGCTKCLSSAYMNTGSIELGCDAVAEYRKGVYRHMINVFSDIDFWKKWPVELIKTFKLYIDNIIKTGLVVNNSGVKDVSIYRDCVCSYSDDNNNLNNLKRLSESLGYIINNDVNSHKNYIYQSLYTFASMMYEYMQWN